MCWHFGAAIKKAEADATQLADLTKTVKDLDGKVKDVEPLKTKVAAYEKTISDNLIESHFTAKALAAGVKKEAIPAALKLANLSTAKVDLAAKTVTGVTQEVFDGLKTQHAFLFAPAQKTAIPAIPPVGGAIAPVKANASAMDHLMAAQAMRAGQQ